MKKEIEKRLSGLSLEYNKGKHMLGIKQEEVASLQREMLRISGAVQVLEELLKSDASTQIEK